ncbi:MAG: SAM-dependent chlorinase/fluorinase [Candidatus Eisenbacteria bacterium]|uniref:SAM-dependent chlorinase/fluorinase n=1 Tax=Eiseniibacteriota bacterium TaxID=2212470 RepID=A0A948RV92_UNCEI|nr:SAM-dependent chlorinase/fluorinase [Candidatus Eisenbacteria bacterium]MBU1947526.1 SAM-dependent chlorinase/fluorinase [Candidatus Eisenbacteria bacterium]MBU2691653.1 SAM-dependent chlorinase/fluorinase [Candidatus Eisenbacteria bacterium]
MSFKSCGVVTLLTDFGTRDEYVGSMKGVILSISSETRIIDITHEVPPQDIMSAAFILGNCYHHFPPGTVHCVVADPGVGSERKPLLVVTEKYAFVGPDNGVFSRIYSLEEKVEVREITNQQFQRDEISDTFHGRDIFSPAAAHLSRGAAVVDVGPVIDCYVEVRPAQPETWHNMIKGEAIHIDSYGNIITNISQKLFKSVIAGRSFLIEINGRKINRLTRTYQDGEMGKFLALFGSTGMLEISVRGGSAQRRIGAGKGDFVLVNIVGEGISTAQEPMF